MVLLAATALLSSLAQSKTHAYHMTVMFNGLKAGDSNYTRNADDTFSSDMSLAIGTTKIVTKLTGKYKSDYDVESFIADLSQGPNHAKLELKNGQMTLLPPGAKEPIKLPSPKGMAMGNLLPQLNAGILKSIDFANKTPQPVKVYFIDAGSSFEAKFTPLTEKTGKSGHVKIYRCTFPNLVADYALSDKDEVVGLDVPSQKIRFIADGWADIYVDPFDAYPELSKASFAAQPVSVQKLKTRDGVTLVQDVFLPVGEGKFPVVFERTPYDRHSSGAMASFYTSRGYAYVVQDCRGRTDSDGEWDPFVHEVKDGYDSLDWISKQPWCDGNIGMIGASYGGFVQWAAAVTRHPALKCIIPQVSPPMDAMHNIPYDHGTFFLYGDIWWGKIVRGKNADMSTILATLPNPKGFTTLPLSKVDDSVLGYDVTFYNRWLDRPTLSDWKDFSFYDQAAKVTIPALHISGWWDGDEIGTNMNWEALAKAGNKRQWLIYGPWNHFFNSTSKFADVEYGEGALKDLDTLYIRWFDTWLKHKNVGMNKIPKVQAFVTGSNKWLTTTTWPAPNSKVKTFYFATDGSALGLKNSKGVLLDKPRSKSAPSVFTFDPAKVEVPKAVLSVDPAAASTVVNDKSEKGEYLTFRSAPLEEPMTISGPYDVEIHFKTSARDTDFFVNLFEVDEKGVIRVFGQSGKIRASYIGGYDKVRPLTPNKTYVAHVNPWDVAHELKKGCRLGVMITSSGFPVYARNMGTGEPIKNATRIVKQRNSVLHDAANPSQIRFRVISE